MADEEARAEDAPEIEDEIEEKVVELNNSTEDMSENEAEFVEATEDNEIQQAEMPESSEATKAPVEEKIIESVDEIEKKESSKDKVAEEEAEQPVSRGAQKIRIASRFHKREQRDTGRQFLEMIGKHEVRNEELEKQQGDLQQRLDMLECSMPAVMVWNIWRMAQGAPVSDLRRIVEKQFQQVSETPCCPRTPSRHYDCRVREIEAERKEAQKRADEARTLWAEKEAALEERKRQLEDAKKIREERKQKLEELNKEVQALREALEKMDQDGFCIGGECGDIQCRERWLGKVSSSTSIKSVDLEYLERIQELAEAELCMKRQIADLEYREDTYMRTLQEVDECWSKVEGQTVDEQLAQKTATTQELANRVCELEDQLEAMRSRLATCRGELEKYLSIDKIEALIGRDDDIAGVADKATGVRAKMSDKITGDKIDLTGDAAVEADRGVSPDDYEAERQKELDKYFAMLGSLDELDEDDGDFVCDPDFVCNDVVTSPTGMDEEELARVTAEVADEEELARVTAEVADEEELARVTTEVADEDPLEFLDEKYDDDFVCDADFICNDVVTSPTGMDVDELAKYQAGGYIPDIYGVSEDVKVKQKLNYEPIADGEGETPEIEDKKEPDKSEAQILDEADFQDEEISILRSELVGWLNILDPIRETIAVRFRCLFLQNQINFFKFNS